VEKHFSVTIDVEILGPGAKSVCGTLFLKTKVLSRSHYFPHAHADNNLTWCQK